MEPCVINSVEVSHWVILANRLAVQAILDRFHRRLRLATTNVDNETTVPQPCPCLSCEPVSKSQSTRNISLNYTVAYLKKHADVGKL